MTPPDLSRLTLGERIQDPLLVLEYQQRDSARGGYVRMTLGNASGRLPAEPFWSERLDEVAGIRAGDVVQVIATVGEYDGSKQLKVSSIRPLPRSLVNWTELLPSVGNVTPYWNKLDQWRADMKKPRLKAVLALFYDDPDFRTRYEQCPAAPSGHHAALGGLLQHTVEVAHIGRQIAGVARADQELVVAGALLHDIGKLESYAWDGAFTTTVIGRLHGHVTLGVRMLERRIAESGVLPCTPDELDLLEHFILSHHGRLEYGAAVQPMTLEAEILHYADNASAKSASMADALRDDALFTDDDPISTKRLWQLDNRFAYRFSSDWGVAD
jgi:3'-5' exoribonuclease